MELKELYQLLDRYRFGQLLILNGIESLMSILFWPTNVRPVNPQWNWKTIHLGNAYVIEWKTLILNGIESYNQQIYNNL